MFKRVLGCSVLVLLSLAQSVQAWGLKEHILLTRLAVIKLIEDPTTPAGLKTFLQTNMPEATNIADAKEFFMTGTIGAKSVGLTGLQHWCVEPDNRSSEKTPTAPFGLRQQLWHFVDLEYLNKDPDKRVYKHDLSSMPNIAEAPKSAADPVYKEAGISPFSVKYSYDQLVASFKAGKLASSPTRPTDEDHAVRWAGFMVHYIEDSFQPHHGTQDYQSKSYFADKRNAPNVHSEMEYKMNDDKDNPQTELRTEYWAALEREMAVAKDPSTSTDPWLSTFEVYQWSYKNLPLIGSAAMAASGQEGTPEQPVGPAKPIDTVAFFHFKGEVDGKETTVLDMKARQQAAAVARVTKLLRQAWDEAHPAK